MYNLASVFEALDQWIARENVRARAEGALVHRPCTIRVLGQAALFAADTGLTLVATQDLDAYAALDWPVQKELERLLAERGLVLDPHGREAWMPRETEYAPLYDGTNVDALVADVDAVLISKALKAPQKNRALLVEYLAKGASARFFELAKKYEVDLEGLV